MNEDDDNNGPEFNPQMGGLPDLGTPMGMPDLGAIGGGEDEGFPAMGSPMMGMGEDESGLGDFGGMGEAAADFTGGAGPKSVIDTMIGDEVREVMGGAHAAGAGVSGHNINAMLNVSLNVQIVLGQSRMPIAQLLNLSRGSVIELDKRIGEPVDVMINDRLVARGDLVKVGDNRIGVTLTEIVKDYVSDL